MEVHAHSHTARKKWTHYFWEFFMLFLAVTLGFFVENQREHIIEHQREKQYIRSMIEDLSLDTSRLEEGIVNNRKRLAGADTLLTEIRQYNSSKGAGPMYYYHMTYMLRGWYFQPTDRTMEQLKNAGGLRLIRKQEASNAIVNYDNEQRGVVMQGNFLMSLDLRYLDLANNVFDLRELQKTTNHNIKNSHLELLASDNRTMGSLYNTLSSSYGATIPYANVLSGLKQKAIETIKILKEQYHISE